MPDADNKFVQATDSLIALYRTVERSTLDLPFLSFMPMLIFFWAFLKFYFFLVVGAVLIIPINFIILIRNLFPGHWRYRPFFLTYVYCVWAMDMAGRDTHRTTYIFSSTTICVREGAF